MDGELHRNERLYAMANQIADNLEHGRTEQETVDEVASHIRRFWSRDMKQSLFAAMGSGLLNPIAEKAAELLAEEYKLKAG
ncbi:NADH-dependent formate dehydrogenase delta subunit FdsD [Grimontia celer]|uniref:NADH-dependent formate dehydrogenase delta subunit FdsD n=1 Tax=Grimontia celer TaxID=1796497 RepID=A0A128F4U5_9GAMM|nr:formate dehydrogenase subunit delta [Grimontia celer]CZF81306.1 NADH-dependent formate dehydrogenase delta subunit FdsD [Grimontia celer]